MIWVFFERKFLCLYYFRFCNFSCLKGFHTEETEGCSPLGRENAEVTRSRERRNGGIKWIFWSEVMLSPCILAIQGCHVWRTSAAGRQMFITVLNQVSYTASLG